MPDMRFAPPNPIRIADRTSGLNAVSVRSHNERLVLSMLLQHGDLSRMKIGERSGLSAQTISVIVRSLEKEGLILSGEARRARVGPPTIPLSLNPEGVFAVGISIGFRQTDVVLINFVGQVITLSVLPHETPGAQVVHPGILESVRELIGRLSKKKKTRLAGIGLALPDAFGDSEALSVLRNSLADELQLEVFVQNDVTAAAASESMFGVARALNSYLFFYIGAYLHSRLILNHQIMRSSVNTPHDIGLLELERMLGAGSASADELWQIAADRKNHGEAVTEWTRRCACLIREKAEQANQFVDVRTVILSSLIPKNLVAEICEVLGDVDAPVELKAIMGEVDSAPKAVGAASLAFTSRFMV